MYLIVDGYNVIKSSNKTAFLRGRKLKAERDRLIELLIWYQKETGSRITIVFDETRRSKSAQQEWIDGIEVLVDKSGSTADDVIKSIVAKSSDPKRITFEGMNLGYG